MRACYSYSGFHLRSNFRSVTYVRARVLVDIQVPLFILQIAWGMRLHVYSEIQIVSARRLQQRVRVMTSAEPNRKAPYSADLRWRMVWQRCGLDLSFKAIAGRLCVSPSTVFNTIKLFEETGDVLPAIKPHGVGEDLRKLDMHHEMAIIAMVLENPTAYLQEICSMIEEVSKVEVSESTVCRVLRRNGFTRKKVRLVASQRSMEKRAVFMARVLSFKRDMLVFVDETGSDARNYVRKFGYSLRGTRAECLKLLARGKRISAVAAIDCQGLIEVEFTNTTVQGDYFLIS